MKPFIAALSKQILKYVTFLLILKKPQISAHPLAMNNSFFDLDKNSKSRGGELALEGGAGMCRGYDPLFSGQSALPRLTNLPSMCHSVLPFSICGKICICSIVLG